MANYKTVRKVSVKKKPKLKIKRGLIVQRLKSVKKPLEKTTEVFAFNNGSVDIKIIKNREAVPAARFEVTTEVLSKFKCKFTGVKFKKKCSRQIVFCRDITTAQRRALNMVRMYFGDEVYHHFNNGG